MKLLSLQHTLRPLLLPAGIAYKGLMGLRRSFYARKLLASYNPNIPCVSVGNISWGGTGKTPVVSWLLDWSVKHNLHAAVLTRGYRSTHKDHPLLVTSDTPPALCGDEPLLLAKKHPQASVVVFPKRVLAAEYAMRELQPDFFILDDGMQHLSLHRHINLVLLHPQDLTDQWDNVIPAGSWREGKKALQTATAFAIKTPDGQLGDLERVIRDRLEEFQVPLFTFMLQPEGLISLDQYINPEGINKGSIPSLGEYVLVTGIGEPLQAVNTIATFLGSLPKAHLDFPDHHQYTESDVQTILQHDLPVVCTAKDAEKLAACLPQEKHDTIFVCETKVRFGQSIWTDQLFPAWWETTWHDLLTRLQQQPL